jgi:hypothetical protein
MPRILKRKFFACHEITLSNFIRFWVRLRIMTDCPYSPGIKGMISFVMPTTFDKEFFLRGTFLPKDRVLPGNHELQTKEAPFGHIFNIW